MPQRRVSSAFLAWLLWVACLAAVAAPASGASRGGLVRMNEIQVIGTHNSYHREISAREQAAYDQLIGKPGDYSSFLAYSHARIANQFEQQDVRGLELDLFPDPQGGLYAEPLVRKSLGLGPLPDPAWLAPGIKTFHVADLDYNSTCVGFVSCLEEVRGWSAEHPDHVPLLIMLELKQSNAPVVAGGGVQSPPWDAAALDALDAEIRSVFDADELITPDDVRRPGRTLEESVLSRGWPTLRRSRGKVVFLLDNEPVADGRPNPIREAYTAGRPSLEGRVVFTNAVPGSPDAAFLKRNDPLGAETARIAELVRAGYLVRTRSDLPLATVKSGDTAQLEAALASGAQLISTDFPQIGMSARWDSDFAARLPEGGPVRCNPVNAPANCRTAGLEPRP